MGSGKQKEQRAAPEELIDVCTKENQVFIRNCLYIGSYSAVYEEITDLCLKER